MAKEQQHTDMTPDEVEDRVWELAKKIDICMFTTWDGERQRARPLSARVFREEHALYFLVDIEGHKNHQVDEFPTVTLTFTDSGGHKYVAITGQASVSDNRAKITELWSAFDKAWWDDANDPAIRLITVTPEDAELWDSPNQLVAATKMLVSAVTGAKPDFGDNAKVQL
jgi:general stress protein 26